MGRIRASGSYFLDLISEEIGCTAGVLLTDRNIRNVAERHEINDLLGLERSEEPNIVFRPEDFEDAVLQARQAIGNLKDTKPGKFIAIDTMRSLDLRGIDWQSIADAYLAISKSGKYKIMTREAIEDVIAVSGAKPLDVLEFLKAIAEMQNRSVGFLYRSVTRKKWDGAVALDRLFQGEQIPDNPEVYFDQRYIDYLAMNAEEIGKIHWRNFERLTTEFFKREGYEVDLGAGTKDGGVDVRVWTDKESKAGPPLMLIQCKRYKDVVGIETVKAFWADVHFEGAEKGLIATTSSVSRDSKRVCDVRKWPMSFAEAADVERWARTMWRHAPEYE